MMLIHYEEGYDKIKGVKHHESSELTKICFFGKSKKQDKLLRRPNFHICVNLVATDYRALLPPLHKALAVLLSSQSHEAAMYVSEHKHYISFILDLFIFISICLG